MADRAVPRWILRGLAAVLAAACAAGPARAQTAAEDAVRSRYPPPEYKPIGVDIGYGESLLAYPKMAVGIGYTDNLFRDGSDRVADEIVTFAPSIDLRSDWDNHLLEVGLKAEIASHIENPSEDYIDAQARVRTRLDITEDDRVDLETSLNRRHEDRSSRDDEDTDEPTIFHVFATRIVSEHQGGAVHTRLTGTADRLDYDDNGVVDNDDRDRVESELRFRAGYEIVEAAQPFVEVAGNHRNYDVLVDNDGIRRGSEGWEALVGNTFDVSGVTFVEAAVGYQRQTFEEPTFDPVDGPTIKARGVWNATDLLTLNLRLERRINETTVDDNSSVLVTDVSLGADYIPLDHMLATARVAFGNDEYEGGDGEVDRRWRVDLGVEYLLGSDFVVGASYIHDRRRTSNDSGDYIANDFVFRVSGQL